MLIISLIAFIILPILSIILLIIGATYSKKYRMIYMIGIAFVLAIIAYKYIPTFEYDLYRHHLEMDKLRLMNFSRVLKYAISEVEILRIMIMYIISKFNNNNILQFIIAFCGYTIIFFMITDYAKRKNIKRWVVLLCSIYLVFTLNYIYFISGLWNYIAMIIFALGVYIEYILKKTKWYLYALYLITPFIHISMLFVIVLKVLCKIIAKDRVNLKSFIIISIMMIGIPIFISIISKYSSIPILSYLVRMYQSYFINGSKYDYLHRGNKVIVAIIDFIIYLYAFYCVRKKANEPIYNIAIIFFVSTLILMISSSVFIRFIFLAQLIGLPILMNYLNNVKLNKTDSIISFGIMLYILVLIMQRINYIKSFNYGNLFDNGMTSNIVTIFKN